MTTHHPTTAHAHRLLEAICADPTLWDTLERDFGWRVNDDLRQLVTADRAGELGWTALAIRIAWAVEHHLTKLLTMVAQRTDHPSHPCENPHPTQHPTDRVSQAA